MGVGGLYNARGFCYQQREIGMGTHPIIGLVRYNLEFCTGYLIQLIILLKPI